jgi:type II secretory pathway pseudopilin PulG
MTVFLRKKLRKTLGSLQSEYGIGIVESIVAIGLLGMGIVALIGALSTASIAVKENSQSVVARQLAETQVETIKAAPYDVSGNSYTTISAPIGYSVAFTVNSLIYATTDIQKIVVTVARNGTPVLTVENYKTNR